MIIDYSEILDGNGEVDLDKLLILHERGHKIVNVPPEADLDTLLDRG